MTRAPRRTLLARGLLAAAGLFVAVSAASAHDTWLLEERDARSPSGTGFRLTSGERFPRAETAIKPERIDAATCRDADGQRVEMGARTSAVDALGIAVALPHAATWQCAVTLAPRPIALRRAKVAEYLAEIHASASVRRAWRDLAARNGGRWTEVYRKVALIYVDVGEVVERRWWRETEAAFALVPDDDPTRLYDGTAITARVVAQGRPVAGQAVVLHDGATGRRRTADSDAQGRVTFALPRRGGNILLAATRLVRVDRADADWQSDFATLTVRTLPIR